jgi:hypothetical protein
MLNVGQTCKLAFERFEVQVKEISRLQILLLSLTLNFF